MAAIVVPFRGTGGKRRLRRLSDERRARLRLAMLADVVAAALGLLPTDAVLIVNADVPCVTPYDLRSLVAATPPGGIALVASEDGRTNALSLPAPHLFQPLYGARSAERFRNAASDLGLEVVTVAIPNLADDVDTEADLERVAERAGPRTQTVLAEDGVRTR